MNGWATTTPPDPIRSSMMPPQPNASPPAPSPGKGSGLADPVAPARPVVTSAGATDRAGDCWVSRKVGPNGVVCVDWQQVPVGKHRAGQRCDVLVGDQLLQFWIGEELMKTVTRTSSGEVRKKHAQGSRPGH
jgi:hypothetical protein